MKNSNLAVWILSKDVTYPADLLELLLRQVGEDVALRRAEQQQQLGNIQGRVGDGDTGLDYVFYLFNVFQSLK